MSKYIGEKALKLRKQGLSYKAIGEKIGIAESTARKWCNPHLLEHFRAQRRKYREKGKDKDDKHDKGIVDHDASTGTDKGDIIINGDKVKDDKKGDTKAVLQKDDTRDANIYSGNVVFYLDGK